MIGMAAGFRVESAVVAIAEIFEAPDRRDYTINIIL